MRVTCLRGGLFLASLVSVGWLVMDLPAAELRDPPAQAGRQEIAAFARVALNRQVEAQWRGVPLRTVLKELDSLYAIPIVLDRRLDPSIEIDYARQGESLGEVLGQFAARAQGAVGSGPRCLYLGPALRAEYLETLIESQTSKLKQLSQQLGTPAVWFTERHVKWDDLATPREILEQIGREWSVTIWPLEKLPHDRWGGADLRNTSLVQALAIVLMQLDCGWTWELPATAPGSTGQGLQVVIAPLTTNPSAERTWELPPAADVNYWRERLPQLQLLSSGTTLVAAGKSEDLNVLERLVQGEEPPVRVVRPATKVPLSRRRITITLKDVTIRAVLEQLAAGGVAFEYDPSLLTAAGVKLERVVEFSLEQASLDELLEQLFSGQPVRWEIGKESIELKPTDEP